MNNIKNIIDTLLQPSSQQEAWKINLIKNWPTIIGSLHEKVSLQKINPKSLVLGVYDSSWMQELYLLSKLILRKVNSHFDHPRIETLRFQCIERINTKNNINKKNNTVLKTSEKKFTLKPRERSALEKINDPQLSVALEGFLRRCQQ